MFYRSPRSQLGDFFLELNLPRAACDLRRLYRGGRLHSSLRSKRAAPNRLTIAKKGFQRKQSTIFRPRKISKPRALRAVDIGAVLVKLIMSSFWAISDKIKIADA